MKKIYTYISMLMLLLATACQQDELVSSPTLQPGEYRFTATIPEPIVASRALGEQPQNVQDMPMRVRCKRILYGYAGCVGYCL